MPTGLESGISIAHATITHSLYNGLYLSSLTGVIITDSTISNNATGVSSSGSLHPDDRKHAHTERHGRVLERHEPADFLGQHRE